MLSLDELSAVEDRLKSDAVCSTSTVNPQWPEEQEGDPREDYLGELPGVYISTASNA